MSSATIAVIDRRVEVIDGARNDQNAIRRVSDLRALPFVVLLGEPGIGKSTVLEGEAAREGGPVLKVRELMTGARASRGARPDYGGGWTSAKLDDGLGGA